MMETEKKNGNHAEQESEGGAKKNRKPLIIALLCIAIAVLIAGGIFLISANARKAEREQREQERLAIVQTDVFLQGISVGGIDVSGMTMEQAQAELLYHNATLKDTLDVEITYQDKVYPFAPAAAGVTLNYEDSLAQALRPISADGDYDQVMAEAEDIKTNGRDFPILVEWEDAKAREYVAALAEEINVEPQNATFKMEQGQISYIADVTGLTLDEQGLIEQLRSKFELGKKIQVEAPVQETEAEIKLADIEGKIIRRSVFETSFASSDANRSFNVTRATNAINGVVVKPGETFSMNDTIGPRTYSGGWKPAPAIINGGADKEMQAGGGVCQVSTTLYNAVAKADLEIVYRRNHSSKVGYVDAGLDATINTGTIDFTWKNNTNSDIFIVASAEGKRVHIEIYGEAWPEEYDEIRLTSDYIGSIAPKAMKITQDSTKPTGYEQIVRKEKSGSKYASYKHYYKDGKLVKKEFLANSTYNAVQGEKIVGTGAVQPTPTQPVTPSTTPTPTQPATPSPSVPKEPDPVETDTPAPTGGTVDDTN